MDSHTPEQRRKNMQAVKSKGSKIENLLAKELFGRGIRYRRNSTKIFGKPDLSIKKYKLAVFADSEFWHGKNWEQRRHDHKSNQKFWTEKIERNMARDLKVNEKLAAEGWTVLRFWGKEIEKNSRHCADIIVAAIDEIKRRNDV